MPVAAARRGSGQARFLLARAVRAAQSVVPGGAWRGSCCGSQARAGRTVLGSWGRLVDPGGLHRRRRGTEAAPTDSFSSAIPRERGGLGRRPQRGLGLAQ